MKTNEKGIPNLKKKNMADVHMSFFTYNSNNIFKINQIIKISSKLF